MMYVTPTVHPTAWITPLFYCQFQQVKSQEVKLSSEKNARVVGLLGFCMCIFSMAMGKDNPFCHEGLCIDAPNIFTALYT